MSADDEWTVQIDAAFPTRSGSHDAYAVAMRMVGNRHTKGDLVALVNWLLVERDKACRCAKAEGTLRHAEKAMCGVPSWTEQGRARLAAYEEARAGLLALGGMP